MFKSIADVLGCYILSFVLVMLTDPLLSRIFPGEFVRGQIPSRNPLIASTCLFFLISTLCAWLCARWAPARPSRHVLWLFIIGELFGIAATIPNWNKGWPHWYWLSWLIAWPIACWIGLQMGARRQLTGAYARS
jgi:hypothetical protein